MRKARSRSQKNIWRKSSTCLVISRSILMTCMLVMRRNEPRDRMQEETSTKLLRNELWSRSIEESECLSDSPNFVHDDR